MLKLLVATFLVINLMEAMKHDSHVFESVLRVIEGKDNHEYVKRLGKLFLYRTASENVSLCLPKVFQIKQYIPAGYTTWLYVDAYNSRKTYHFLDPTGSYSGGIELYHPQNHTFDYYEFNGDNCNHTVEKGDYFHVCYSPDFTIKEKFTVGIAQEGTINALYLELSEENHTWKYLATAQNYIPISSVYCDGTEQDSCEFAYYSDVQLNVFDPSVFTPPVKCNGFNAKR